MNRNKLKKLNKQDQAWLDFRCKYDIREGYSPQNFTPLITPTVRAIFFVLAILFIAVGLEVNGVFCFYGGLIAEISVNRRIV